MNRMANGDEREESGEDWSSQCPGLSPPILLAFIGGTVLLMLQLLQRAQRKAGRDGDGSSAAGGRFYLGYYRESDLFIH